MSPTLRQPRNLARYGFRLIVFMFVCAMAVNVMSSLWTLAEKDNLTRGNIYAPSVKRISPNTSRNPTYPDTRSPECKKISYVLKSLPKASVVIYLRKETAPIVVTTIAELIHKTPVEILHEIIIIDDVSEFKFPTGIFMKIFPKTNIFLFPALWRLGTAKARNVGAKRASGDVVVFLDANIKVNHGWLEPILTAIKGYRKTVVQPVFDVISSDLSKYRKNAGEMKATITWKLQLSFGLQGRSRQNNSNPFPTPIISGECFAVDRKYFLEMGGLDTGLREGIEDNIELSIRIWLCGGNLKILPCSRVVQFPSWKEKVTLDKNLNALYTSNKKRIAETWLGNYRKYFYFANDGRLTPSVDNSEMKPAGTKLKCNDFGWFIRNVVPEMTVSAKRTLYYGKLQNMKSGLCVGFDKTENSNKDAQIRLDMKSCLDDASKSFVFGDDRLTFDGLCAHFDDNRYALLSPCSSVSGTNGWSLNENRQLQWDYEHNGCAMHVTDPDENSNSRQTVMLMSCEHEQKQFSEWKFQYEIP